MHSHKRPTKVTQVLGMLVLGNHKMHILIDKRTICILVVKFMFGISQWLLISSGSKP